MNIHFSSPHQYLFFHYHIKHLLVIWKKELRKDIYIVQDDNEESITVKYPGETYRERVLQEIEAVFFQTLEMDQELFQVHLVATFPYQNQLIGIYQDAKDSQKQPFLFAIVDEELQELTDQEYEQAWHIALQEFPEYFRLEER
ncbi:hypothetical protein SAMN05444392_1153 [Seinonella peptonophila]|uniref:Uncharacterized protein n=1 Tax=Seinonella peptonophila TaxID=112248 RepID=A0A1M5AN54_9BACL|nr:hypothetical protein [Seinonella peptonophila]SHF31554.1 hypothetical protein SAMN05444392_1153 [Seinonella peptonophila]